MSDLPSSGQPADRFELPEWLWQELLAHIHRCLPEEACGLLGGRPGPAKRLTAEAALPIENELHSPVRFRMAPAEQLKAFYWLEEHGLDLLAIFHSHPQGPEHPSATDLAEFAYPGVLMLILSPRDLASPSSGWQIRAFRIDDAGRPAQLAASELPVTLIPGPKPDQT